MLRDSAPPTRPPPRLAGPREGSGRQATDPGQVRRQLPDPAAREAMVQLSTPSVTVTFPVGVPVAGLLAAAVTLTVMNWPVLDGLGLWAVMLMDVSALLTVCETAAETLPITLVSPP